MTVSKRWSKCVHLILWLFLVQLFLSSCCALEKGQHLNSKQNERKSYNKLLRYFSLDFAKLPLKFLIAKINQL